MICPSKPHFVPTEALPSFLPTQLARIMQLPSSWWLLSGLEQAELFKLRQAKFWVATSPQMLPGLSGASNEAM
jgi:hypothetical protein